MRDEVTGREPARIEGGRGTASARPDRHQTLSPVQTATALKSKEPVLPTLLPTGSVTERDTAPVDKSMDNTDDLIT
jgi:hypothetical protein